MTHELSSVYNHESNGLAEAGMRRAKEFLEKCCMTGEDFDVALREYLGTLSAGSEFAPAFREDCCCMCVLSSPIRMLCDHVKNTCLQKSLSPWWNFKWAIMCLCKICIPRHGICAGRSQAAGRGAVHLWCLLQMCAMCRSFTELSSPNAARVWGGSMSKCNSKHEQLCPLCFVLCV